MPQAQLAPGPKMQVGDLFITTAPGRVIESLSDTGTANLPRARFSVNVQIGASGVPSSFSWSVGRALEDEQRRPILGLDRPAGSSRGPDWAESYHEYRCRKMIFWGGEGLDSEEGQSPFACKHGSFFRGIPAPESRSSKARFTWESFLTHVEDGASGLAGLVDLHFDTSFDSFLPSAQAAAALGRVGFAASKGEDDAIESVYDEIHTLIEAGEYKAVNYFLQGFDVPAHTPATLLSVLTITALSEVKERLSSRPAFFRRVREYLKHKEGPQETDELLVGLG